MHTIYYDGYCNLCVGSVSAVEKYGKKNCFAFAEINHADLPEGYTTDYIIVKKEDGSYLSKAAAVRFILFNMSFPFSLMGTLFGVLPLGIQNTCYTLIARYRYRLFGKRKVCTLNKTWVERK